MCGIAGFTWHDEQLVQRMTDEIVHRGPDQSGAYADDHVSLGSRRLSIIDLSEHGRMPLANEDRTVWVIHNGEIYNFAELRDQLRSKGHTFTSDTDTEVIVHAYEEYGPDCVKQFNGMFSFAVWDAKRRELFLARDRLGIKPLFYAFDANELIFASEIKSMLKHPGVSREVDLQSLYHFMGYEYVPTPATIFKGIHKLPPGHYLRFSEGSATLTQYWDVSFQHGETSRADFEEMLRAKLTEAVTKRLVSDVPLGAFLSGGLDSSAMVALMRRAGVTDLKTFSLGYEDASFSELPYADLVAKQFETDHTVLMIDPVTPEVVEQAIWHLDDPMTDLSNVPLYLLCKKAREHVTVVLSGEGGDELLMGYDRFVASKLNRYYSAIPRPIRRHLIGALIGRLPDQPEKKGAINMLKRFIEGGLLPEHGEHMRWQYFADPGKDDQLFSPDTLAAIDRNPFLPVREIVSQFTGANRPDTEQYVEMKLPMLDNVLTKVDRMSMAHSLEIRVPFLDHEFVELCASMPADMKLKGFTTKSVFRTAMQGILPETILKRGKQGFSLPVKNWLRNEMRDYMTEVLSGSRFINETFNRTYVDQLVQEHLEFKANHSHTLWALINLGVWHQMFVEQPVAPSPGSTPVVSGASAGDL